MPDPTQAALLQRAFRYALALTHDHAAAEDLLHDAWIRVSAKGHDQSLPYLLVAIRHRWVDLARRRAAVPMVPLVEDVPAAPLGDGEVEDEVARALGTLAPDEREALFLNAVEGWTAEEIGRMTGRPRNTILTVLARARRRLTEWRAALEVL